MKEFELKPSVTDLIGLLDNPALMKWANKIGLAGTSLDDYRRKSRSAGTSLHKQIETHLDGGEFADADFGAAFISFFKDKRILAWEQKIETEWFVGRYDIRFEWMGVTYIADFKSNQTNLYLENKLQLAAYRMAEKCDAVCVIGIPKMNMIRTGIKDFSPYEETLRHLTAIWHLKKTL